jgi:site-specific recombinase XerC
MAEFRKYFTEQEEKHLLNKVRSSKKTLDQRDFAWMEALRCTGLRIEAFSLLNVSHAKEVVRAGQLNIEAQYQKRNIKHEGYVTKRGILAFKRLLRIRKEMGYKEALDEPLIMSRNRQRMSVRSYQDRMQKWVKAAGLPAGSPHWWRHTLAKRIVKNSTTPQPLLVVQSVLDHTTTRNTGIYTQPDKEEVEQSLEEAM